MKRIFNNVEFTEVKYIYRNESIAQDGILIHDLNDVYGDGDAIVGNNAELPETIEDAMTLLSDPAGTTYISQLNNTLYHID